MMMLASPSSIRPIRWCTPRRALGHAWRASSMIRFRARTASGSYASYSRNETRRPRFSPRTSPRNDVIAPSPVPVPATAFVNAAGSSASDVSATTGTIGLVCPTRFACPSRPEMIDWPVTAAELRSLPDGPGDITLGERNRFPELHPKRQMRRDGCRKRASRAMRMTARHAFVTKLQELPAVVHQIHDVVGRKVTPLDHDGGCAERR